MCKQHKTTMINEEWNKTQNDAPFVPFYDMYALTFVLPDEMADVSIAGLQWFILIPLLNQTVSHRPIDSYSKPYLHREKKTSRIKHTMNLELVGKHGPRCLGTIPHGII